MDTLLSIDKIFEIHAKAVELGFHRDRDLMLADVNRRYGEMLRNDLPNASKQQLSDLQAMNQVTQPLGDGSLPLQSWLHVARLSTDGELFPNEQRYFRELADELAKKVADPPPNTPDADAVETGEKIDGLVQQKILWVNDMLPLGFIVGASRTALSVAKLIVPRHEGGAPKLSQASGQPVRYFGTGWLIGASHIITNHHVVSARSQGEAAAGAGDLDMQAAATLVQFDYDDANVAPAEVGIKALRAADPALDFAVLELAQPSGRAPLPLQTSPIVIDPSSYLPVNIIQHPLGQPKQIAIRNNLAAAIEGGNLAYYTDTQSGSSGSPVCDDRWNVIALHKASTPQFGKKTYQGRDIFWVNIGTPMGLIVDRLKADQALWDEIGASLAAP